jgi:uncharacterized protein YutE (UPF0331/DUF86 family)
VSDADVPAAPLEADDPARARTLKTKVAQRMRDVKRHLDALRVAMAEFGEDFEVDTFRAAFHSADPAELNRVKAVERGVDLLYNYIAEVSAFGLELAKLRQHHEQVNAYEDLNALERAGVLTAERRRRLQQLRGLRRMLTHEYVDLSAEQVHESAQILIAELPPFYTAYVEWIRRGFAPTR